ncbi:plasmid partitioning protein RepB C-terminal domain-containing protein [Aureimonas frigidaquae]|uniref:plasmid partitioning protein RepB C-terminal domain-containing protein n=1 Tax=Aureimonas frigidaquae TaxID=424757 RepID=UPI000784000A|nr:plasmid partitioning protein RepB C-terminal domain-containing protein [Aureimonas frigidaquae]
MTGVRWAFKPEILTIPLAKLLPTKALAADLQFASKFRTILASVREVGIVEPLAVYPQEGENEDIYILLDGHMRLEALKILNSTAAPCLVATDDEAFTYNRQITRLSAIQEHRMILTAIERGVPRERIAAALEVDVDRIRERQNLLKGIAPEVAEMLKNKMANRSIFAVLRKMKPMRQIEAAEMMIAANIYSLKYVEMIYATTRPEQLEPLKGRQKIHGIAPSDLARMEREMEKLNADYKEVEDTHGETMLTLVVAKGYISRLLGNANVLDYLKRYHNELTDGLFSTMEGIATDARRIERE